MLILDKRQKHNTSIIGCRIPVGTVFNGVILDYKSRVFLRTYNSIVSLEDPKDVWTMVDTIPINSYQPLKVTLIIEGNIPYPQHEEDGVY